MPDERGGDGREAVWPKAWFGAACRLTWIYDQLVINELRAAVDAFSRGDVEPFVSLIDENCVWRGVTHGHLWWKHAPS